MRYLFLNVPLYFQKGIHQLLRRKRLQHILINMQLNRPLGILKLIMPRQNNELNCRKALSNCLSQLQPIHERHLNIRHYYIRQQTLNHFQRFFAILRLIDNFKTNRFPIYFTDDAFAYILFIIH
ncbi:hypothetical protein D3C84_893570 [compost metagenome]